jgi:hypothetical protein
VAQCPAGLVISSISDAAYGSGFSVSANSYREVYKQCIGQLYCAVQAANRVFGDPMWAGLQLGGVGWGGWWW